MEWKKKCDQSKKKLDNLFDVLLHNLKDNSDENSQNIISTIISGKKLTCNLLANSKSSNPTVEVEFEAKAYKTEKEFKSAQKADVNQRYTPEVRLSTIQATDSKPLNKQL